MSDYAVVWHDLECHGYVADLPLWHELARAGGGRVLEVGAGTGRVALDLAAAGFDVTALDNDPVLLAALRERAERRSLSVVTVAADASNVTSCADARHQVTLAAFALVVVPMQTVQLLGDRAAFLAAARRALAPGGLLAMAIAADLETFEGDGDWLPEPDVGSREGWQFASHPVAIRVNGATASIERVRETTAPDGSVTRTPDRIELTLLSAAQLEAEGASNGFAIEPRRVIESTDAHVGSTVVMLRA